MKKIKYLFLISLSLVIFISCDKEDRFSGSPVGVDEIINLVGQVSTNETIVSTNQTFKFTATIPRTFDHEVTVEATTLALNGSRRRGVVKIPAGQTSAEGSILAPAATDKGTFTVSTDLYLSAIVLDTVEQGKHFLLSSNKITIKLGESGVPISNSNRCIVRFDWQGPWGLDGNPLRNDMNMIVKKDGVVFTAPIPPATNNQNTATSGRYETFSIVKTYPDGDYTFEAKPSFLNVPGFESLPYRFIVAYPNETYKTIEGAFSGLSISSPAVEKLKIRKATDTSGEVTFTIIP